MIYFNGFPFLDTKEKHTFHVTVSKAMTPAASVAVLPEKGLKLSSLTKLLSDTPFSGFPIVSDITSRTLIGYIGRTELTYAIAKAKQSQNLSPDTECVFNVSNTSPPPLTPRSIESPKSFGNIDAVSSSQLVDFASFADFTPLSVHPRLPLETAMEIFKKMGPRVILVENKGQLDGLVTVKDCLRYQFKVEAQERGGSPTTAANARRIDRLETWTWDAMVRTSSWLANRLGRFMGGRIKLTGNSVQNPALRMPARDGAVPRDRSRVYENPGDILDRTVTELEPNEGMH